MLTTIVVLFALGCLSGVTTVLFGFGGGFATVPVVYSVAAGGPDAMHVAVGTSAAVMVVNSLGATLTLHRSGRLRRDYLWPFGGFVAVGAVVGTPAATAASDSLLHALFAAYLGVTILDGVLRRGFLHGGTPRPLGRVTTTVGGVGIGVVASFLGVGGSVLTVPLLRRRGRPARGVVADHRPGPRAAATDPRPGSRRRLPRAAGRGPGRRAGLRAGVDATDWLP